MSASSKGCSYKGQIGNAASEAWGHIQVTTKAAGQASVVHT